ncbi:MAG: carboxypeptidase regulatory-like domain-containing protein, partial [Actinomycetia bacterium]|nr:carboxypeptidase regulatory-like domain-containing protein [Actinomycetes bacterium]
MSKIITIIKRLLICSTLIFVFSINIYSGTATITGKLTDKNTGENIVNAVVILIADNKTVNSSISDSKGYYYLKSIIPGRYLLKIKLDGFRQFEKGISISEAAELIFNFEIERSDSYGIVNWRYGKQNIQTTGINESPIIIISPDDPNYYLKKRGSTIIVHNNAEAKKAALEAARTDARIKLVQLVKNILIDSETRAEELFISSNSVKSRIYSFIRSRKADDIKYLPNNIIKIDISLPLTGNNGIITILPTEKWGTGSFPFYGTPKKKNNMIYTGLVIDCRGLGIEPALVPKVLDEDGNIVFGIPVINKSFALEQGVVTYSDKAKEAINYPVVAAAPFFTKAISLSGRYQTDPVISNTDAATLLSNDETKK